MSDGIHNVYDDSVLEAGLQAAHTAIFNLLTIVNGEVAGLDGAAMRGTDNAALAAVCTEARLAELDAANIPSDIDDLIERQRDMLGNAGDGRAYTATLRVSPDGTGADGLSRRTAYTTLNAALDAASTDANDLTLILMAPGTYDINQPGQPTWTANVVIQGTHRCFTTITNTHATASCVLRLEGQSVVQDVMFIHINTDNGLIMTEDGAEVHRCHFDGTALEGLGISLFLLADSGHAHAKVIDCDFEGNTDYTIALKVDTYARSNFERLRIHNCERGIWIQGSTAADFNLYSYIDIGHCVLGLDIDQGNEQFFHEIVFHNNTRNVDDEVKDHTWVNIHGFKTVTIHPDNFTGDTVNPDGAANTWGADSEIIAAIDNPFRVVAVQAEGSAAEKFRMRFSADSGTSHYDDIQFEGAVNEVKRESSAFVTSPLIFNTDTRISASAKSESGGNNAWAWIEIQEI